MQPSEFWRLPICDFWAEVDSRVEEARKVKEISEGMKGKGGGSVFSSAQWEEARRKHREKMKAKT
jgi:hypothetical protein